MECYDGDRYGFDVLRCSGIQCKLITMGYKECTKNVQTMQYLFYYSSSFEGKGIDKWMQTPNSKLYSTCGMFAFANSFDADLSLWNTSMIIDMVCCNKYNVFLLLFVKKMTFVAYKSQCSNINCFGARV